MKNQTIKALMEFDGRTDRTKFRHQVLDSLLKGGYLQLTIPGKPTSPNQAYELTALGRHMLENSDL